MSKGYPSVTNPMDLLGTNNEYRLHVIIGSVKVQYNQYRFMFIVSTLKVRNIILMKLI